ncbi:hypothetical protein Tcan_16187 [Toxocara canis]|uniref:Uncharacterized protein n=1 Tax=Toxocara canis TaxID=6265 RepID=A0A0B2VJ24_TOXCA|nr:hypothetical protein Tcan_16187 [Toxocara canis]
MLYYSWMTPKVFSPLLCFNVLAVALILKPFIDEGMHQLFMERFLKFRAFDFFVALRSPSNSNRIISIRYNSRPQSICCSLSVISLIIKSSKITQSSQNLLPVITLRYAPHTNILATQF